MGIAASEAAPASEDEQEPDKQLASGSQGARSSTAPPAPARLLTTLTAPAPRPAAASEANGGTGASAPLFGQLRSVWRPLGNQERHFAAQHEVAGVQQITTLATLEPAPEPEDVCAAAGQLQSLHPELRAALVRSGGDICFDSRAGGPVEVHVYEGSAESALDTELHRPLQPSVCGWRVAVCGPHLLLTYHHAFLDGRGIMVVLEDLLELLAGRRPDAPAGGGCSLSRLMEEDMPWPRPISDVEPHLVLDPPALLEARPEQSVPCKRRRQRFLWRSMAREPTGRLLARCRESGSSAQGALAAATALALSAEYGGAGSVRALLGVDCRKACSRGSRTLACCAESLNCVVLADRPFWEIARSHKQDLIQRLGFYEHLPPHPRPVRLRNYEEVLGGSRFMLSRTNAERAPLQFSNRGAYDLATDKYRATAVYFAQLGAPDPGHALFFVNACTVGGTLCLTLCYDTPACSVERATRVLGGIMAELQAALDARLPPPLPRGRADEGEGAAEEPLTWRVEHHKLPEREGLGMQPVPGIVPDVATARRLAERSEHCVGFAFMELSRAFYFKQRDSGFDETTRYKARPGFQWHYIAERAVAD